jgi:eukaryotic-like serine/threonine-protein kinase
LTVIAADPSPYDVLIGTELIDGWVVQSRATRSPGGTGGTFSVCYNVSNAAGDSAFCKVLDYQRAVSSSDPVAALQQMTADFQHEVSSLNKCRDLNMRRVVLALESSTVADPIYPMSLLSYIIFEPAIGDLRVVLPLDFVAEDLSLRFGILHDAVVGIAELHQAKIAHQDIKPSNILAVENAAGRMPPTGKIADLGRAIVAGNPHRFDGLLFPGDRGYAPPEYLYDFVPAAYDPRRRGTDLYQIGSLVAFVLSGVTMSALLYAELDPSFRWDVWSGDYADVEPVLREATDRAIEQVVAPLPTWAQPKVTELLVHLCDPDPARRNGMNGSQIHVSNYSLGRVISLLDRLQKQAALNTRRAA